MYSAVEATDGSNINIKFPSVDTECMSAFLQEISNSYPDSRIAFIMDGAGWHKSNDLEIPKNITIFFLPPYSPELNPVERFWLHLKQNVMRNRVFESMKELENNLENFINSLTDTAVAQLCNNNYLDI
jgi:transposase